MNCGFWSDTTSLGKPCRRKTCCNSASAVSLALGNLGMGMKCIGLENVSATVSTMVLPLERVSPAMKSKVMSDQGHWGTGRGWSRPAGEWEDDLFLEQMGQAATYSPMSFSMADLQNRCLMMNMVQETPCWKGGWPGLGLGWWRSCSLGEKAAMQPGPCWITL